MHKVNLDIHELMLLFFDHVLKGFSDTLYTWGRGKKSDACAFLMAQTVKNLPAMKETGIQSLDWEDHLEKEMATHFSILAWRIPWTEEPGGL